MSNENKSLPAFPTPPKQYSEEYRQRLIKGGYGDRADFGFLYPDAGVNKREYFAVKAMQGMLAYNHRPDAEGWNKIANDAVSAADALLEALNK